MQKQEFLNGVGGRFFRIEFVKKSTGEIRVMRGRVGVNKHKKTNAKPRTQSQETLDFNIVVWDLGKKEYRSFDIRTLVAAQCGAFSYKSEAEFALAA